MKKKIVLAAVAVSCMVMAAGCGKSETANETTAATEAATEAVTEEIETGDEGDAIGMANPWVESDKTAVTVATNVELDVPEDAENVSYSYLSGENLAQVTFTRGGENWIYRGVMTDSFDDISGMYYDWDNEEEVTISGRKAMLYDHTSNTETVWMIDWYDEVPGVMYSLSVTAADSEALNGLDMQGMAEALFVPMRDEVDGDAVETEEATEAAAETEFMEETETEIAQ